MVSHYSTSTPLSVSVGPRPVSNQPVQHTKITECIFNITKYGSGLLISHFESDLLTMYQILFCHGYIIILRFNATVLLWLWHLGFVIFTLWDVTLRLYGFQVTFPCTDIKTAVKGWERTRPFSEICGKGIAKYLIEFCKPLIAFQTLCFAKNLHFLFI